MKTIRIKYFNEIPKNYTGIAIDGDGDKYWYVDGKKHRTDGPAIERVNGYKEWYINGKLHRTDGPAIEYTSGYKYYYLHGIKYTYEQWLHKTKVYRTKVGKLLYANEYKEIT